ncbi:hypothetical protein PV08_08823 [Exophiala spinifera]|uniref:Cation/H+ exchanger transmembrane domain-containing protein n=1 Tax=Exophiala spinifera TaxID=91928 RepID=A0A0D1ZLD7_9EURO|nr:uncharacterized protein PV08_08823 [Exophiala spinifera]KIW13632.1 hypothetical protein PV08_08823 [Exophiala spinifera]
MPTLVITNFNIVCSVLGGFITVFGLVSYLLKERFYLSEALISLVAGIIFSPHATNWIRPLDYADGVVENLDTITLYFTRLVLGVQLVLAGVQLPSRYLYTEWRSLFLLLGPGMTLMWLSGSLLIWAMVPHLSFLHALAVAACVTPTDPVLSNSIVKGKFADKNIPKPLQKIIIAESGANDGLGYPFLFLALYLIKYTQMGGAGHPNPGGAAKAMGYWFGETWGYTILLSVVYGIAVGWLAKELLHYAEEKKFVDRESFLVFAITLALFITGTCGLIGSDDVLACFVAGNVFTWDDWFRLETADDSLQPTIDMLLNISVFIWFGAVCPWAEFRTNDVIPLYRLVFLGILILLFRRVPMVFAMHKKIREIEEVQQAAFVGFFGPIGVSAIFYLYISLEFLNTVTVDGEVREDAARLQEVMRVVIWFLAICSIVVHGLSVPLGKLGYHFPRTISQALSSDREDDDYDLRFRRAQQFNQTLNIRRRKKNTTGDSASKQQQPQQPPSPAVFSLSRPQKGSSELGDSEARSNNPPEPHRPIHFPDEPSERQQSPATSDRRIQFSRNTPSDGMSTPSSLRRDVGERGQDIRDGHDRSAG